MFVISISDKKRVDEISFEMRQKGIEIRDIIQVLGQSSMAVLGKKPGDSTYVNEYLRTSSGLIDIDRGRISIENNDPNFRLNAHNHNKVKGGSVYNGGYEIGSDHQTQDKGYHHSSGRFPTNTVLIHHPQCKVKGVKKVKGVTGGSSGQKGNDIYGDYDPQYVDSNSNPGYASDDGTETVDNWCCVDLCPIKRFEEVGGYPRYFKQVKPDEFEKYLQGMLK